MDLKGKAEVRESTEKPADELRGCQPTDYLCIQNKFQGNY